MKNHGKLFFHSEVVEEAPIRFGGKCHKDINVTTGPEVVSQNGAKEGQFFNPPALTERFNLFCGASNLRNALHLFLLLDVFCVADNMSHFDPRCHPGPSDHILCIKVWSTGFPLVWSG